MARPVHRSSMVYFYSIFVLNRAILTIRLLYSIGRIFGDVFLNFDKIFFDRFNDFRAFASEQLNPNLYQDGKVCVSLLGTWSGKVCPIIVS